MRRIIKQIRKHGQQNAKQRQSKDITRGFNRVLYGSMRIEELDEVMSRKKIPHSTISTSSKTAEFDGCINQIEAFSKTEQEATFKSATKRSASHRHINNFSSLCCNCLGLRIIAGLTIQDGMNQIRRNDDNNALFN